MKKLDLEKFDTQELSIYEMKTERGGALAVGSAAGIIISIAVAYGAPVLGLGLAIGVVGAVGYGIYKLFKR